MSDDGWTEVKSKKKPAPKPQAQQQPQVSAIPRATYAAHQTGQAQRAAAPKAAPPKQKAVGNNQRSNDYDKRAIDKDDGNYSVQKVGTKVGQAITRGRQEKGLTQKDLALQIQEKVTVVQEYESGRAVPNQKVLTKMEKALGVQLKSLVPKRAKEADPE